MFTSPAIQSCRNRLPLPSISTSLTLPSLCAFPLLVIARRAPVTVPLELVAQLSPPKGTRHESSSNRTRSTASESQCGRRASLLPEQFFEIEAEMSRDRQDVSNECSARFRTLMAERRLLDQRGKGRWRWRRNARWTLCGWTASSF